MSIQQTQSIGLGVAPLVNKMVEQPGRARSQPDLSQRVNAEAKTDVPSPSVQRSSPGTGEANMDTSIGTKRVRVGVHNQPHRPVVTIVDSQTNEVIREIPPEEILNLSVHLQENLGKVFNQNA